MKRINNRSGFTLLEIIVVIIIVGVLASLALPRFFQTINFSRSTEALNAMGVIKRASDHCAMKAGALTGAPVYTGCNTFPMLGIDDPGTTPGANFTYGLAYVAPNLTMTATDVVAARGIVRVVYNTGAGTITRTGTNDYAGLR
jgi:prepilin-type N-terminal cleavage/methylation domain-containing protein